MKSEDEYLEDQRRLQAEHNRQRGRALSFLTGLALAGGQIREAESYLLELLAWAAFCAR